MKMSARSRASFFKLCGKHALLSVLCAPREFRRNSPAKTQAAARRSHSPSRAAISKRRFSLKHFNFARGYDVSWLFHRRARVDALRCFLYDESVGRLAQLVRAPALQAGGRRFEPCTAHHPCAPPFSGDVVQLVRTLPSRWLESHTVTANSLPCSTERAGNRHISTYIRMLFATAVNGRTPIEPKLALYFSADVSDCFPSPPARATAPRLRVRVPLGANRPVRGPVVRRVQDRFRMREV